MNDGSGQSCANSIAGHPNIELGYYFASACWQSGSPLPAADAPSINYANGGNWQGTGNMSTTFPTFGSSYTLAFGLRLGANTGTFLPILLNSNGGNTGIYQNSNHQWYIVSPGLSSTQGDALDNTDYVLVISVSPEASVLYLNGTSVPMQTSGIAGPSGGVWFGTDNYHPVYTGWFKWCRVWNRALTSSEAAQLTAEPYGDFYPLPSAPLAPVGMTALALSISGIVPASLSANSTSYSVEYSGDGMIWANGPTGLSASQGWTVAGLMPHTTYVVRYVGVNQYGTTNGADSSPITTPSAGGVATLQYFGF
nr:hypothetical protein [uncultured Rhodopila sp.]